MEGIGKSTIELPVQIERSIRVTAAIIQRHEQFLLVQRPPGKAFELYWEFPGGKVEPGETLQSSLRREIKEELCWDVRVGELFHKVFCRMNPLSIELYSFWCHITGGDLSLREHISFCWAHPKELRHFLFTQADRELARMLEAGFHAGFPGARLHAGCSNHSRGESFP
ncbi:MAG: (deoxy)nucleoside triphosphate pyrophosphohydrolase [Syntrophobacteraceae bacterium]|nr:(deoxy)nucleoside triphosphate pyrophosphohydrolase [Syntrophobacteraceae bacterium]